MIVNWPERLWVNSPLRLLIQRRETRFFKQLRDVAPGSHVLEIGCGRGAGATLILDTFQPARLDALDIDYAMIDLAVSRKSAGSQSPVLFYVGDAQYLPYPDSCLDAVFNFGIIHHLEDWRRGITEVSRVLKVGGGFYFEEVYPPLYANMLLRHVLDHPTENRFHGPEYRAALEASELRLLPGYRESRFGILGVAEKRQSADK